MNAPPESEWIDTAEFVVGMVEDWVDLTVAALREKHGDAVARDAERATDALRTFLMEAMEVSERIVVKPAVITSVDGLSTATIREINEQEKSDQ